MPAVLQIGYARYLVKSEAAAMAALKALVDAIEVGETYDKKTFDKIYYPETDRRAKEISLTVIKASQLRRSKPGNDDEEEHRETKLLEFNGTVHYAPDAKKGAA